MIFLKILKSLLVFNIFCLPENFNTNILHQLFDYTLTFVNSHHQNTNSKCDLDSKTFNNQELHIHQTKSESKIYILLRKYTLLTLVYSFQLKNAFKRLLIILFFFQESWVNAMRSFENGTLKMNGDSVHGMPPHNMMRVPMVNAPAPHLLTKLNPERMFLLGDPRTNQNPAFLVLGIVFYRWHNFQVGF